MSHLKNLMQLFLFVCLCFILLRAQRLNTLNNANGLYNKDSMQSNSKSQIIKLTSCILRHSTCQNSLEANKKFK